MNNEANKGRTCINGTEQVHWYFKVASVIAIAILQGCVFYLTYELYHIVDYPHYLKLETSLDTIVPYISWTWVVYYFGFAYIIFWGAAGLWHLPRQKFIGSVKTYFALVVIGGVLHLLIPSDAPWPLIADLSDAQRSFKSALEIEPLAAFPSMHASMSVLPAIIGLYTFRSRSTKLVSLILSLLVCISVVTAKEHWAIDVPVGMILGLATALVWHKCVWKNQGLVWRPTRQNVSEDYARD